MDLYEFTQILRRQKWLLLTGALVIIGLVVALSIEVVDGSPRLRFQPRYESTIQMAVVPADFDSLGNTLPNVNAMAGSTALYATILSSPEAAAEISEQSGVKLLSTLAVTSSGRDGFLDVKATAGDPDGAIAATLYSFTWLEQRITTPPSIVRLQEEPPVAPTTSVLDENGRLSGTIVVDASPSFVETGEGLWIGLATTDSKVTVSLADAAARVPEFAAVLEPGGTLLVSLEDVLGKELDAISVAVPPLPDVGEGDYSLLVRLDRGILQYTASPSETVEGAIPATDVSLLERHIGLSWQQADTVATVTERSASADAVGLLLLTEKPIAEATGGRRGPILILAALGAGFFALTVAVVGIDAWRQAKSVHMSEQAVEGLTITEIPDRKLDVKPPRKMRRRR